MQKNTRSKDEATCRKTQNQKTKLHIERHKINGHKSERPTRSRVSSIFLDQGPYERYSQFSMWILKNIILPLGIKSKHFVQISLICAVNVSTKKYVPMFLKIYQLLKQLKILFLFVSVHICMRQARKTWKFEIYSNF